MEVGSGRWEPGSGGVVPSGPEAELTVSVVDDTGIACSKGTILVWRTKWGETAEFGVFSPLRGAWGLKKREALALIAAHG
jgi:hypothetical protein